MVSALQLPDNAFTGVASTASGQTTQETPVLCTVPTGIDYNNNPTYPNVCGRTLAFPRFALSDGKRLYVADSGNDRVLVYETIPTQNAPAADVILGQPDEFSDVVTSAANGSNNPNTPNLTQSASNVIPGAHLFGVGWGESLRGRPHRLSRDGFHAGSNQCRRQWRAQRG